METLNGCEIDLVTGGYVTSGDSVGGYGAYGGIDTSPAAGSGALAYQRYQAALAAWQTTHPNLPPEVFDDIYYRR